MPTRELVNILLLFPILLTNTAYHDSIDYRNSLRRFVMQEKLFESEAKVMEIIWARSPISAKDISLIAAETIGWNKNTTYTDN